jgi:single-stranded-DNA-specific exonuclease
MGNPVPKLLIENCWFENAWHRNQQDSQGKKVQYIKAEFDIRDDSTRSPFPGVWWGHYKDELPLGRCDCIAELDYNTFKKRLRNPTDSCPFASAISNQQSPISTYSRLAQPIIRKRLSTQYSGLSTCH